MNTAQALHNAARRYCLDNYRHWCEVYSAMPHARGTAGWSYTPRELNTFPRYNVLNAMRVAVETIDPELLDDFDSARSLVLSAGCDAEDDFTRKPGDDIAAKAQSAERAKFYDFVHALTKLDVWNYEPLPYRRVLSVAEANHLWSALGAAWGVEAGAYWFPLSGTPVTEVAAFRSAAFHDAVPAQALRRKLAELGVERVWELREYGPEYLQDVELFEPRYTGAEGFWTSPGYTWVIYASHEDSITVAGTLLPEIQRLWPVCDQHRW